MIRFDIYRFKKEHSAQFHAINECERQKSSVTQQLRCGIITEVDAVKEKDMIDKKERAIKKKLVQEVHVSRDGTPRKFSYSQSKKLWYTIMPGSKKRQIYAHTEAELYEKLFQTYGLVIADTSVYGIFTEAILQKSQTDNNNEETINRYRYDYSRFITEEFARKDIRSLTGTDLKAYTQELVNRMHPAKKAFFKYKSVLNLIWDYAIEHEIVTTNPVKAIVNKRYYKSCEIEKPKSENKILSADEISSLKEYIRYMMERKNHDGYFINGYAALLSIETGMRAGELPALKWEDVKDTFIHIHAQQLTHVKEGGKEYYYAPWTKNERESTTRCGRKFPLTENIRDILDELRAVQEEKGIISEFVFCHEDGEWIKTDAYETCFRRMCRHLGFSVSNNHALRMSLNSNIFIPLGIPVAKRAELLGHSVETNLRHYSYATKDDLDDVCDLLNGANGRKCEPECYDFPAAKVLIQPHSNQKYYFPSNKKSRNA